MVLLVTQSPMVIENLDYFSDAGSKVVVKWSEIMQDRVFSTTIVSSFLDASALCPVRALKVHVGCRESRSRSASISYSVSCSVDHIHRFKSQKAHQASLTKTLELLKICTLHDFMWGGATLVFPRGVPSKQIQMQGTWSSSRVWCCLVLPLLRPFSSGFCLPTLSYYLVTSTGFGRPCFASKIYSIQPLHCILITCFPFSISTTSFTYDITYSELVVFHLLPIIALQVTWPGFVHYSQQWSIWS